MGFLCMAIPRPESWYSLAAAIKMVLILITVSPIILCCTLLNRYIFKSADMTSGTING